LLLGLCVTLAGLPALAQSPAPIPAAVENKPAVADRASYLSELATILKAHWPRNRTVHLVCYGHSVPAGYFKTPVVDTFNAYPHLLHAGIKERCPFAVLNVIVTAIGGENSEGGAARFDRDVLALRTNVVTIAYGLNDRRIGGRKSADTILLYTSTRHKPG
jgi:lysophospholipase L1-like esterase